MNKTYQHKTGTSASILFQRIMYIYNSFYTYHLISDIMEVHDHSDKTVFTVSIQGTEVSVTTTDGNQMLAGDEDRLFEDLASIIF